MDKAHSYDRLQHECEKLVNREGRPNLGPQHVPMTRGQRRRADRERRAGARPRPEQKASFQEWPRAEMLAIFLETAVPLEIEALKYRGGPTDDDFARARQIGYSIAEGVDGRGADEMATLVDGQFKSSAQSRQDVGRMMAAIAFALAVGAFVPGGTPDFLGRHWEAQ